MKSFGVQAKYFSINITFVHSNMNFTIISKIKDEQCLTFKDILILIEMPSLKHKSLDRFQQIKKLDSTIFLLM